MNHPLSCRCGTIQGHVVLPAMTSRAVCFCEDCQAYARFLGEPQVLDDAGGTDIVATLPRQVHFDRGLDALVCMSLSPKGLLRWYAGCCKTPIGNTPRDRKVHYVGLVHSCLSSRSLDKGFGAARVHLNAASATRPVPRTTLALLGAMVTLMRAVVPMRFHGRYRENPFFDAGRGEPIRAPRVLTAAERQAL